MLLARGSHTTGGVAVSVALNTWKSDARRALDEIASAHAAVGGRAPGRRYATQEINHAYAVLLSSQFQRFCRDLHTEAVDCLVASVSPQAVQPILLARLREARRLDRGNPNPGNLGADFGRLGLDLWPELQRRDSRNRGRQRQLQNLADWRNAIAHQDFAIAALVPRPPLRLTQIRAWRSVCNAIAKELELLMGDHLESVAGVRPW